MKWKTVICFWTLFQTVTSLQLFDEDGTELIPFSVGYFKPPVDINPPVDDNSFVSNVLARYQTIYNKNDFAKQLNPTEWLNTETQTKPVEKQLSKRKSYFKMIHQIRKNLKWIHGVSRIVRWVHSLATQDVETITARFLVNQCLKIPALGTVLQIIFVYDPTYEELFIHYLSQLLKQLHHKSRTALTRFIQWYFGPYSNTLDTCLDRPPFFPVHLLK